jgi:hypothetical protein
MSQQPDATPKYGQQEPLSPELVLIDPQLAVVARQRLPERMSDGVGAGSRRTRKQTEAPATGRDGRDGAGSLRQASGGADSRLVGTETSRHGLQQVSTHEGDTHRRWRRRLLALSFAALLLFAAPLGFFAQRLLDGATEAGLELRLDDQRAARSIPTNTAARPVEAPRRPRSSGSAAERPEITRAKRRRTLGGPLFVWVPVARASYYNVRFIRGRTKVYEAWPTKPRLRVPLKGVYKGRRFAFVPGRYTWRVRPGFGPRSRREYGQPIVISIWRVGRATHR